MCVATAIIGSAVAGGAASIFGASQQASAAGDAAQLEAQSAQAGIDLQREIFNQNRADVAPFREAGGAALGRINSLLGFERVQQPGAPQPANALSAQPNSFAPQAPQQAPGNFNFDAQGNALIPGVNSVTGLPGGSSLDERLNTAESQRRLRPLSQVRQPQAPQQAPQAPQSSLQFNPANDQSLNPTFDPGAEFSQPNLFQPTSDLTDPLTLTPEELRQDPGYQFRLTEGEDAVSRAQRARGLSLSGGALEELSSFASGLASQEFGNVYARKFADAGRRYGIQSDVYRSSVSDQLRRLGIQQDIFNSDISARDTQFNRLASVAGLGQTANNQNINSGQNFANAASNLISSSGTNQANAALAGGAAFANGASGVANSLTGAANNFAFLNAFRPQNALTGTGNVQFSGGNAFGQGPF